MIISFMKHLFYCLELKQDLKETAECPELKEQYKSKFCSHLTVKNCKKHLTFFLFIFTETYNRMSELQKKIII